MGVMKPNSPTENNPTGLIDARYVYMVRPRDKPLDAFSKWYSERFGELPQFPITEDTFYSLEETEAERAQQRDISTALSKLKEAGLTVEQINAALSE